MSRVKELSGSIPDSTSFNEFRVQFTGTIGKYLQLGSTLIAIAIPSELEEPSHPSVPDWVLSLPVFANVAAPTLFDIRGTTT
jgi:hypothetical protein